jgi:predicted tellurium resistance membrane protein TerC
MSIPLIIFGSTMLLKVMEKYPVIITLGAALLGYLAGEMFASDPAIHETLKGFLGEPNVPFQILGILLVVVMGLWMKKGSHSKQET